MTHQRLTGIGSPGNKSECTATCGYRRSNRCDGDAVRACNLERDDVDYHIAQVTQTYTIVGCLGTSFYFKYENMGEWNSLRRKVFASSALSG